MFDVDNPHGPMKNIFRILGVSLKAIETREESSSKRAGDELEQEKEKKQKVDEDKETAKLQSLMKIIPDEEEVAVDCKSSKPFLNCNILMEVQREDLVWRNLQGNKVLVWKLFDSCGVHFVRFQSLHVFMLVEKRYPLTPATITKMLNKKLQADHWNKCLSVLKLIPMIVGIKRLLDDLRVTAAQFYRRPIPRHPQQELTPITSPWPFHKWGIDIAGPFPVAAGGLKFLIVAIDYFTKWIEAKAVATITGNQVKRFVWDNIVCRFGLPGEIVLNNGKQFCDNPFKDWCTRLSITQRFASVKHPQTNGLVERANRSLGEGIKACLDRHKGRWVEELSHVLWAHRTTIKVSTGDTPFSLVYGTEAVIPAEIGMPTIRTAEVNIATNDDERRIDLDILEERREQAAIRDFVYRANDASHAEDTGKLGPKWEGPYEVTEALGKGAYKLRDMDGRELPRTWNICNLKKCYL
ncbi:reverse transcriptase domain-containing protein [Tanacetum coccineum]